MSDFVQPHRRQPTRLPHPWDSPGKNTGVGCHFLLQCMKVKSKREVTQSGPTLRDPMDCSPPGSSTMGFSRQEHWSGVPSPSPRKGSSISILQKNKWTPRCSYTSGLLPLRLPLGLCPFPVEGQVILLHEFLLSEPKISMVTVTTTMGIWLPVWPGRPVEAYTGYFLVGRKKQLNSYLTSA